MLNRYTVLLAVGLLVAAGLPAEAQDEQVITEVQAEDADANRVAVPAGTDVLLVYVDADGDGNVDAQDPDETIYLSLGNHRFVSFGDIRLTRFLTYPSGTAVNYTNRDVDLFTEEVPGWFAQDPQGDWYVDVDDGGSVSVGDLAIGQGVTKVASGDPAMGTELNQVHETTTGSQRFIYIDDGPTGLDWGDRIYLDVDTNDQANAGELRIQASRLGIDDTPTGREFRQAVRDLEENDAELREELIQNDKETQSRIDQLETSLTATRADLAQAREELSSMDTWLLVLGLVDLAAVAGVGYWVYRTQQEGPGEPPEGT